MSISTVKATINGQTYNLTLNSSTGKYEATLTAPGKTSFNQTGGYYNVAVVATNTAGTSATADASTAISTTAITGGYQVTYTPASALSDGAHTVTIDVSDNDGNAAAQKSTTYTVDTIPPTLNLTAPTEGFITATSALTVAGTTNDATSSPVSVAIKLNGTDQGAVSVGTNGAFSKAVTLAEGSNTIVVTATDAAGKTTTVTRTVTLDTSVPKITAATITPNPVDAGASMVISVTIA